ncbi:hypothetical protein IFM61392_00773 [Aspergillus lentulus]|uniref:Uncharacterized protein n=1 Tax=Aspergillus lentulus TaxID=293939 RepID=A0AAN5YR82_ASPLE|nr:hypothetical protein CNMCM6069_000150 [Aspergillus lentulus]KAF4179418.1 hypothetical protein CNMCM7927_001861 [Aspergillus lentulus]KAF4205876.1 hypothetical protein CNMCM8927_005604 [Aspergillus lentulus]GFF99327.1 hypothetical protein IFM61392_00773 [Aspergillus lentulus]
MNDGSVIELVEHKQSIPQQRKAQAEKGRQSRSHTERSGNQLIAKAATDTRGAMDEGWHERSRARLFNDIDQVYHRVQQAEEKCRRQKEEIEEIHHEASKLLMQKDQHIAELTKRLNAMQYHPDILNDDEVVQIMANLSQKLDVWVKGSFKDPSRLQSLPQLEPLDVPYSMGIINKLQSMHQNWAFIRAFVTSYLFYYFFDVYMVGVRNADIEYSLITMESEIFDKCPGHVADNWRSATSMGIQSVTKGYLDDAAMNCMRGIEQLGSCASADAGLREKKVYELFQSCVDFKRRLERQSARYKFSHTPSGHRFISSTMQSVTGQEGEGAVVEHCLWPGLWKGDVLLYPETVWTKMDEASVKDSSPGTETAPVRQDEAGVCSQVRGFSRIYLQTHLGLE